MTDRIRNEGMLGFSQLAAQAGVGVVEGYPHEISDQKMSSSFLYNGTRGFV